MKNGVNMKNINMDNKKKILFVTDYLPNAKNSVGDILHSILDYCQRKGVEPVLVQYNNRLADNIEMCYYDNLKVYSGSKSVNRIISIVNSVRNVILRFFRLYNTFIRKKIFLNLKDITPVSKF